MKKLILEITRNDLFKYKKSERSPQKPLRISCQSVLISRKFPVLFKRTFAKNTRNLKKTTRNFWKEKHREFFTRGVIFESDLNMIHFYYSDSSVFEA